MRGEISPWAVRIPFSKGARSLSPEDEARAGALHLLLQVQTLTSVSSPWVVVEQAVKFVLFLPPAAKL